MNNRSGCAVGRKCCAYFFCLCFIVSALLAGCKRADRFEPLTAAVLSEDQFGDVLLDLQEIDLVYGDSIDLAFSGGYSVKSIPFYPDFYGTGGDAVLTDFYDQLAVAGIGCSFNEAAGVKEGETVTITLDERGKYRKEFEAYYVDPDITKWEGQTDEAFRNAREVTAGDIAEGILYRGSSPFDHSFHRVELMDAFLQEHRIQCVLDLSDIGACAIEDDQSIGKQEENTDHQIVIKVRRCFSGTLYLAALFAPRLPERLAALPDAPRFGLILFSSGHIPSKTPCLFQ